MNKFSLIKRVFNENKKILHFIIFLFINVVNFSFLYFPIKYSSVRYIEFIYFLVISFFLILIPFCYLNHKYKKNYVTELSYSTLFYTLIFCLLPNICWFLKYNIESSLYSIGRKSAFFFTMSSFSLYFNTALIGLGFVLLQSGENTELNFKLKIKFIFTLFFLLSILSAIYFSFLLF